MYVYMIRGLHPVKWIVCWIKKTDIQNYAQIDNVGRRREKQFRLIVHLLGTMLLSLSLDLMVVTLLTF